MIIGSFADKIFETSSNKIYSIENISKSCGLSVEEQEVEGGKPKIYAKNAELKTLSFSIKMYAGLGVNINDEIKSWEAMVEAKTVSDFVLYNTKINDQWILVNVRTNKEVLTNRVEVATIDVELKEFVGFGAKKDKEEDKKESSKKTGESRTKKEKKEDKKEGKE